MFLLANTKYIINIIKILLIVVVLVSTPTKAQKTITCDATKDQCILLSDCEYIAANFENIPEDQVPYCDAIFTKVCCKKPDISTRFDYDDLKPDDGRLFSKECTKFRKQIYPKCAGKPLIIGGTKAEPKQFPFMALLGEKIDDKIKWFCGGTLISPNFVISAAHCYYDQYTLNVVRLGELDHAIETDDARPEDLPVKRFITYPDYDLNNEKNDDIILIELNGTATLSEYAAPACLTTTSAAEFDQYTAAGWGATKIAGNSSSHLLKVFLQKFDDDKCKKLLQTDTAIHDRTQFCAGGLKGFDTCVGDSGGPIFVEHPTEPCMFMLLGVTSFGFACAEDNVPGIYTRMQRYTDWIEKVIWNAGASL